MSDRAAAVLEFLIQYRADRGVAPTYREIAQACGISSTSVVRYYLDYLERHQYIRRLEGVARGIVLVPQSEGDQCG
jgi:repressor LexA